MNKPKTISIENELYVRESDVRNVTVNFTGEETIASRMIGKKVIVRSYNEGINAGTVVLADETGVELKDSRRLFYHKPKNKKTSWYEGIAETGISDDSKVSCTVGQKVIVEKYSMTLCKDEAFQTIMELEPNGQS